MNTYPVNQVFLGNESYLNAHNEDIDTQLQSLKLYEEKLKNIKNRQLYKSADPTIWEEIDKEVSPLTEDQQQLLSINKEYRDNSTALQELVQIELLNLVKVKIESTKKGKDLLNSQLELVKKLKVKIIKESEKEMELFKQFREFSKSNPEITYEEFIKKSM